ncbi:hypothetical protein SAMN05421869_102335 [Nonomuraea jiangxiensis]|uniref:Uncharacterized protein n=1 Tax=Nonomuraea jiangxiensis TaxID=633440 RepID=A0A1G8CMC7_9ACTN|nr:hypothetical protein [Nonomuraea jiangxiensis]SDH46514.1 hypothetical protein SAMN05421869_102335 [Nonomuraea jiangxiensis]
MPSWVVITPASTLSIAARPSRSPLSGVGQCPQDRLTVGRDIPQGTGVESTIRQLSSQKSLDPAGGDGQLLSMPESLM